jgi:hypothetical protein
VVTSKYQSASQQMVMCKTSVMNSKLHNSVLSNDVAVGGTYNAWMVSPLVVCSLLGSLHLIMT